jgi:hypothetical protein
MVSATPEMPANTGSSLNDAIKVASPSYLIDQGTLPEEMMADLLFEDIGGQELINILRNDLVNGQNVLYKPVKNMSSLSLQYSPQNIISLQKASDSFFKNFPIRLENYLLSIGESIELENVPTKYAYVDSDGSLVVNVTGLDSNQLVELQIISNGEILNDTIYEVD